MKYSSEYPKFSKRWVELDKCSVQTFTGRGKRRKDHFVPDEWSEFYSFNW